MNYEVQMIENIKEFEGMVPSGFDLVEFEQGTDPADGLVLYGFDEVGMFGFKNPRHAFLKFI